VFTSANKATVYYLPGTTGWPIPPSRFYGRPAFLWNPAVQRDVSFGFVSDRFGFNISGTTNIPVVVETATNLTSGAWTPVLTNTLGSTGSFFFSDPASTNTPARFYRIVWP
jgi:hypothetical protein